MYLQQGVLDCETHFKDAHLNLLLKAVQSNPMFERRLFFEQIIACKRRNQQSWEKTPISKLFSILSEYVLLHLRMLALRVKELVKLKEMQPYDAFQLFDFGKVGVLSPGNVMAAFQWLGMMEVTHDDVIDYVAMSNTKGEWTIAYSEWLDMMRESTLASDGSPNTLTSMVGTKTYSESPGEGGPGYFDGPEMTEAMSSEELLQAPPVMGHFPAATAGGGTSAGPSKRSTIDVDTERIPPVDEEKFVEQIAARKGRQEEQKRAQDAKLKLEEKKLTKVIRQYKRDLQRARGQDDNPSVVCSVLRFDLSTGFAPDDVTMTGYTYYEPSERQGKKSDSVPTLSP